MAERRKMTKKDVLFWALILILMSVGLYLILKPIVVREQRKKVTEKLNKEIEMFYETQPASLEVPGFVATRPPEGQTIPTSDEVQTTLPTSQRTYPTMIIDPNAHPMYQEEEVLMRDNEVFEQTVRAVYDGDYVITVIGQIDIPKIDMRLPILDNAAYVTIRYGPGRYVDTKEIGEIGNTVIFGHRTINPNEMFHRVNELTEGTEIFIHKDGLTYKYLVTKQDVVSPTQIYDKMFDEPTDRNQLILASCHPIPTWENYMLVYADLVEVTPYHGSAD